MRSVSSWRIDGYRRLADTFRADNSCLDNCLLAISALAILAPWRGGRSRIHAAAERPTSGEEPCYPTRGSRNICRRRLLAFNSVGSAYATTPIPGPAHVLLDTWGLASYRRWILWVNARPLRRF